MSTLFFRKVVPVPIWEVRLKFSKIVFTLAGIWGIVVTVPLYFLFDIIGRQSPPAINHPEFYYSFAGVTLAWQLVFLLIGTNVQRYRMMMAPAILEKVSYVLAVLALFLRQKLSVTQAAPCISDLILAVLFTIAFFKTRGLRESPEHS
jgi:hypothetical protein